MSFPKVLFNEGGCLEGEVPDLGVGVDHAAGTCALAVLEPVKAVIRAPVADGEDHLSDVAGEVVQIAAVSGSHDNLLLTLSQGDRVAAEQTISLMEFDLDMEV